MTATDASLSAAPTSASPAAGMRDDALRLDEAAACADPQAEAYWRAQGCNSRQKCTVLATILHRNGQYHAASEFYRRAADWRDDTTTPFPPVPVLLRDSLLCLIKAGITPPDGEIAALSRQSPAYAAVIRGLTLAREGGDPLGALRTIGHAYESVHPGEETDAQYLTLALEAIHHLEPEGLKPDEGSLTPIPYRLFAYGEEAAPLPPVATQHPTPEIQVFTRGSAIDWLDRHYGADARALFLQAQGPDEAADVLRAHLLQRLGGWWMETDFGVSPEAVARFMATARQGGVVVIRPDGLVRTDFIGSAANTAFSSDVLLSLYRNNHRRAVLPRLCRTGAGPLTRAVNRMIGQRVMGGDGPFIPALYRETTIGRSMASGSAPRTRALPGWYRP